MCLCRLDGIRPTGRPPLLREPPTWYSCGSFCLIQRALPIIHSADTGPLPQLLTSSATSPVASTCAAWSAERMSIHSRAGRSGCPAAWQQQHRTGGMRQQRDGDW